MSGRRTKRGSAEGWSSPPLSFSVDLPWISHTPLSAYSGSGIYSNSLTRDSWQSTRIESSAGCFSGSPFRGRAPTPLPLPLPPPPTRWNRTEPGKALSKACVRALLTSLGLPELPPLLPPPFTGPVRLHEVSNSAHFLTTSRILLGQLCFHPKPRSASSRGSSAARTPSTSFLSKRSNEPHCAQRLVLRTGLPSPETTPEAFSAGSCSNSPRSPC